jgi:hypothetical protein
MMASFRPRLDTPAAVASDPNGGKLPQWHKPAAHACPAGQPWLPPKHWTHWAAWQSGVPAGQSLSCAQTTHVPSVAQIFPGCCAQSLLPRHCTQDDVVASQSGASVWQPELLVHPVRHVKSCGSQMGFAAPQSPLLRHSTHWPPGAKQRGALAGQSVFTAHATQVPDAVSQMGLCCPAQSVVVLHWTQTPPFDASQMGARCGQSPFCAHAAWHWLSPGQQEGAAAPQSLLPTHATHWPVEERQSGVGWLQSPFTAQSTQPRVGLHCWPPRHWLVPLMPQSALPPPREPAPLLPPHATMIVTRPAPTKLQVFMDQK